MMRAILRMLLGVMLFWAATEAALAQGQRAKVKRYGYEICLVSDDRLGDLGKPIGFAYEGREIKVCCKDCRNDFRADPARYMKKLAQWDGGAPLPQKPSMVPKP